jgi:hypothetical protein
MDRKNESVIGMDEKVGGRGVRERVGRGRGRGNGRE